MGSEMCIRDRNGAEELCGCQPLGVGDLILAVSCNGEAYDVQTLREAQAKLREAPAGALVEMRVRRASRDIARDAEAVSCADARKVRIALRRPRRHDQRRSQVEMDDACSAVWGCSVPTSGRSSPTTSETESL